MLPILGVSAGEEVWEALEPPRFAASSRTSQDAVGSNCGCMKPKTGPIRKTKAPDNVIRNKTLNVNTFKKEIVLCVRLEREASRVRGTRLPKRIVCNARKRARLAENCGLGNRRSYV